MRFGFHISIAGGVDKVVERAKRFNCETIQLFSRNPRGWAYQALRNEEINKLKKELQDANISPVVIHLPYLPNLATSDRILQDKSLEALTQDLDRAAMLGASFLIAHVGSRGDTKEEEAFRRVAKGVNEALRLSSNNVTLLLENTSGQGKQIGYNFLQIKKIIENIKHQDRIGICFDTAHAFEAGYNLSTREGVEYTLKEFEKYIGLKKLYLIHLNDSKTPLASRIDRHFHIGQGHIGIEGFRNIINHPRLKMLPAIMETPRQTEEDDLNNMATVRSLEKTEL